METPERQPHGHVERLQLRKLIRETLRAQQAWCNKIPEWQDHFEATGDQWQYESERDALSQMAIGLRLSLSADRQRFAERFPNDYPGPSDTLIAWNIRLRPNGVIAVQYQAPMALRHGQYDNQLPHEVVNLRAFMDELIFYSHEPVEAPVLPTTTAADLYAATQACDPYYGWPIPAQQRPY